MKKQEQEDLMLVLGVFSLFPLFPDPFHPEKHNGEFRRVIFWEWIVKEIWEVWTGIELAFKRT